MLRAVSQASRRAFGASQFARTTAGAGRSCHLLISTAVQTDYFTVRSQSTEGDIKLVEVFVDDVPVNVEPGITILQVSFPVDWRRAYL